MEMIIHVLDKKTEQIVATLENKNGYPALFWDDHHIEKEENNYNTYEFTTIDDGKNPAAEYLINKNKIVIRDLDGYFIPFTIEEVEQDSTGGQRVKRVYAEGEHMELRTAKIIEPTELTGATINTALDYVLQGTRWQRGITEFAGSRTIKTTEYTTALAFFNTIASEFDVQLRFRVEIDGNRIVGRYVDAILTEDAFDGKEITFGKDTIGIRRIENSGEVYTALYAIGPADENGNYVTIESVNAGLKYVEDREALERWSPDGRHLYGIYQYEPESDEKVTPGLLKQKAQEALKNYINSTVKYEVEAVALERITGLEHEKIRKGMTVRIKDEKFNPPLYLEARVLETERSYTAKDRDTFVLGNYREVEVVKDPAIAKIQSKLFRNENAWSSSARVIRSDTPPEDTHAIWIDVTKNPEVPMTYDFTTNEWKKASPTAAEEIGAETPTGAQQKAETAKQEAIEYADQAAEQTKQQAIQQAIQEAEQKLNQAKAELETEIATKADAEWVDGQLVLKANASDVYTKTETDSKLDAKADKATTYTKTEVDNALNSKVSVTQYNTDMNGIVTRLNSAESRVTQTENELATKVSNTTYQQDKTAINNNISDLQTRMSNAETSITQTANQIALKANKTDVYTKTEINNQLANKADNSTVSSIEQRVSQAEAELSVQAGEIATKVEKDGVISAINQSAEEIKIQAEKIDLVGKVTAEHLNVENLSSISANLGMVTAGQLNSVDIQTEYDIRVGNNLYIGEILPPEEWNTAIQTRRVVFFDNDSPVGLASIEVSSGGTLGNAIILDLSQFSELYLPYGLYIDDSETIQTQNRGWIAPTLLNGWVNYGSGYETAGYYKDALGFIHLKGVIKSGTMGAAAFTLPAGYRPSYKKMFIVPTAGGAGRVDIDTSGNVIVVSYGSATNGYVSLDGIEFNT
jgi:phage minor structural protein